MEGNPEYKRNLEVLPNRPEMAPIDCQSLLGRLESDEEYWDIMDYLRLLFDTDEEICSWLQQPNSLFNGETPLQLMETSRTEEVFEAVEDLYEQSPDD